MLINPKGGNVGIGTESLNGANKLEVHGHVHLNGNSLFLRQGTNDQYDVVKWNSGTDRVDIGGFQGVTLGHTRGTANAVNPVLSVRQDGQVDVPGTLAAGTLAVGTVRFSDGSEQRGAVRMQTGRVGYGRMDGVATQTQAVALYGFTATPTIMIGLATLDIDKDRNVRIITEVRNATKDGFTIAVQSWADTILYSTNVTWIAIGY